MTHAIPASPEFFVLPFTMDPKTAGRNLSPEGKMPTYEYECQKCSHKFEIFQSITADPLKSCPKCKKSKLKKLLGSGAGIIFKGSGFYQTDYRSESYKKAQRTESSSPTPPPSSSPGKSDGAAKK